MFIKPGWSFSKIPLLIIAFMISWVLGMALLIYTMFGHKIIAAITGNKTVKRKELMNDKKYLSDDPGNNRTINITNEIAEFDAFINRIRAERLEIR